MSTRRWPVPPCRARRGTARSRTPTRVVDLASACSIWISGNWLGASGLAVPESRGMALGAGCDLAFTNDRRACTVDAWADPASALGEPDDRLQGRHCQMPAAVARLRGDFIFRSEDGPGRTAPSTSRSRPPDFAHRPARRSAAVREAHSACLRRRRRLYGHRGIDLRELLHRAAHQLVAGGAARGASTITQQLAKRT